MSDKTVQTLRRITSIALSVLAVICALALAIACVGIYRSGDRPFTPERIAQAWRSVAIFVWLFIAFTIGSGIFHLLCPPAVKRAKGTVFPEIRLAKIKARLARKQYDDQLLLPLTKQEAYVKILRISAVIVCILCAVYPLIYLNNPDHFTSIDAELNAQVVRAIIPSLCFTAIALAYCFTVKLLSDISYEKAIVYAKAIMLLPAPAADKKSQAKQETGLPGYTTFVLRIVLLLAAVTMIVLGILNGGMSDVLQKAIKICTECIGLG